MSKWLKMMNMKAILPAAALAVTAAIGTTFAWPNWNLDVTNEMKSHTTDVKIDENFTGWTQKEVSFENTGDSSVFLRISYTEYWDDGEGKFLSNVVDGESVATKAWTEAFKSANGEAGTEWLDGGDGWYYYKKVLKAGEKTGKILNYVSFHKPIGEEAVDENEAAYRLYNPNNYHLYFKAEVVQCSDGGNTLNSEEVNARATNRVFGRVAKVVAQNGETYVAWYVPEGGQKGGCETLPSELAGYLALDAIMPEEGQL